MRDYWLTQYALKATGIGFLLLFFLAIALALWLPKTRKAKGIALAAVLLVMLVPITQMYEREQTRKAAEAERQQRYETAKAYFDERCKTAGEKIHRTVDGVEGIQLWGMRGGDRVKDEANPNWQAAGMPNASVGEGYISSFLTYENNQNPGTERGMLDSRPKNLIARGFRFVDVRKVDGGFIRYRVNPKYSDPYAPYMTTEAVSTSEARYAVDYQDISTPEGRANWVAGGHVKVVDTQTGEVLAEMTAFGFEPGFGSKAGARQPWRFAKHCKASVGERYQSIRFFVDQVVKPLQGS
jgi:hypothetical protein